MKALEIIGLIVCLYLLIGFIIGFTQINFKLWKPGILKKAKKELNQIAYYGIKSNRILDVQMLMFTTLFWPIMI